MLPVPAAEPAWKLSWEGMRESNANTSHVWEQGQGAPWERLAPGPGMDRAAELFVRRFSTATPSVCLSEPLAPCEGPRPWPCFPVLGHSHRARAHQGK